MDSSLACFTYENASAVIEDTWSGKASVCILGKHFDLPHEKDGFLELVRSLIWFTYRKGFDAIGGIGPTSDSGWGCMLRCGQMMLSQALIHMRLGNNWKWRPNELQTKNYYKILKSFSDERASPFSIHQIAQMGVQEGKNVGEWFGPNTIAQVLKRLVTFDKSTNIALHVAMDNTVVKNEVESACSTDNNAWKPLLLVIPLRLGLNEINPVYLQNLRSCFLWPQSVGMIGGKPNHAYYFVGCVDSDSLVFLDPHTTQPSVPWDSDELDFTYDLTYHCDSPSRMATSQLDPSLALGFFCKDKTTFEDLCEKVLTQTNLDRKKALFTVVESSSTFNVVDSRCLSVSVHNRHMLRSGSQEVDDKSCLTLDSDEDLNDIDEEFEILEVT